LKPLDADKQKQKATAEKLIELRNSVCGGMAIINMLWIAVNFMFQLKKPAVITFPLSVSLPYILIFFNIVISRKI